MLWGNMFLWPGFGLWTPGSFAGKPGVFTEGAAAGWGKIATEGAFSKFGKPWVWG